MSVSISIDKLATIKSTHRQDGGSWYLRDTLGSEYWYQISRTGIVVVRETHPSGKSSSAWWNDSTGHVTAPEGIIAICMLENKQKVSDGVSRIKLVQCGIESPRAKSSQRLRNYVP